MIYTFLLLCKLIYCKRQIEQNSKINMCSQYQFFLLWKGFLKGKFFDEGHKRKIFHIALHPILYSHTLAVLIFEAGCQFTFKQLTFSHCWFPALEIISSPFISSFSSARIVRCAKTWHRHISHFCIQNNKQMRNRKNMQYKD